jgi:hypothetical protein
MLRNGTWFHYGFTRSGDNDFFAQGNALEQLKKVRFRLVDIDQVCHDSNYRL